MAISRRFGMFEAWGDTFKHRLRLKKVDCVNSGFCGQIEETTGVIRPEVKSFAHMPIGLQQLVSLTIKFATIDPLKKELLRLVPCR